MAIQRFASTDNTRIWEHLNRLATDAEADMAALHVDTGWVNVTLLNGWTNVLYFEVRVRRIGKWVMMRGLANVGSSYTADLCTLPEQFRPDTGSVFLNSYVASGNKAVVTPSVSTAGAVSIASARATATPTGYIGFHGTWPV